MILSRAPTRVTLGGGGTDLKSYYIKYGGFVLCAAINKYCSLLVNKRFYDSIRLSYSQTEIKEKVADIEHPIFKAALHYTGIEKGIELHSAADVPANCGLGTSSSFTVALLNALHAYKNEHLSPKHLAEEACHIEIDVLGQPIGKQDEKSKKDDPEIIQNLHRIKEIGLETRKYLEKGKVDMLGELLHVHWETKKRRSSRISDPFIDECYEVARRNGAIGGKLVGAGGGGFFMFYASNTDKPKLIQE